MASSAPPLFPLGPLPKLGLCRSVRIAHNKQRGGVGWERVRKREGLVLLPKQSLVGDKFMSVRGTAHQKAVNERDWARATRAGQQHLETDNAPRNKQQYSKKKTPTV